MTQLLYQHTDNERVRERNSEWVRERERVGERKRGTYREKGRDRENDKYSEFQHQKTKWDKR